MSKHWKKCRWMQAVLVMLLAITISLVHQTEFKAAEDKNEQETVVVGVHVNDAVVVLDANDEAVARQKEIWRMMNAYADPYYNLYIDTAIRRNGLTDAEYAEIQAKAQEVIAGCSTQYDKIKAIVSWVADSLYYDYVYYEGYKTQIYYMAYDAFVHRVTVCDGYARLTETMMESVGIPCMYLVGDNHAYNAVYDADAGRWMMADATWCSRNTYSRNENGQDVKKYDGYSLWFFDMEPEKIAQQPNHETYTVPGLVGSNGGVYYTLLCRENKSTWGLRVDGLKDTSSKGQSVAVNPIDGIPVTSISSRVFSDNDVLRELNLANTKLTELSYGVFQDCTSLETVKLPSTLTKIGSWAFEGCKNLKDIVIPNSVTNIEWGAFSGAGCKSITICNPNCAIDENKNTLKADVIYGYPGSTAQAYCNKYGLTFKVIDESKLPVQTAGWKQDANGWYYQESDGSYPVGCWKQISGTWYAFDTNGYMREGWFNDGGSYYYLKPGSGVMTTGWVSVGDSWYYMNNDGVMVTGWLNVGGIWYYMNNNGTMATGWISVGDNWYYMNNDGVMVTGWLNVGGTWYYMNNNGTMATGWLNIPTLVNGDFQDIGSELISYPSHIVLIFFPIEGASTINQQAPRLQSRPYIGQDTSLATPTDVYILHTPFVYRHLVLAKHTFTRTGNIGQDYIKQIHQATKLCRVTISHYHIGISPFHQVFGQNLRPVTHHFVGHQQTSFGQETPAQGRFATRCGTEVEHHNRCMHIMLKNLTDKHGRCLLHIIATGMKQGVERESRTFIQIYPRRRPRNRTSLNRQGTLPKVRSDAYR